MPSPEIVYMGGHWSSNVGNAYYDMGTMHVLRNHISSTSSFIGDHPSIWDPRIAPSFSLEKELKIDLLLSGGPILGPGYLPPLVPIWRQVQRRGGKIAFLSAGLEDYSARGVSQTQSLLAEISPEFIITRDSETFEALAQGSNSRILRGNCYSIFLPQAIGHLPRMRKDAQAYALFNFGPGREPKHLEKFVFDQANVIGTRTLPIQRIVRSRTQVFPGGQGFLESIGTRLGFSKYRRTFKNYDFYSDSPAGNLALIANASAVFTDRVHTCAAALSLGVSAQFFAVDQLSGDGRMNLLKDLVGGDVFVKPTRLDPQRLQKLQAEQAQLAVRAVDESLLAS